MQTEDRSIGDYHGGILFSDDLQLVKRNLVAGDVKRELRCGNIQEVDCFELGNKTLCSLEPNVLHEWVDDDTRTSSQVVVNCVDKLFDFQLPSDDTTGLGVDIWVCIVVDDPTRILQEASVTKQEVDNVLNASDDHRNGRCFDTEILGVVLPSEWATTTRKYVEGHKLA